MLANYTSKTHFLSNVSMHPRGKPFKKLHKSCLYVEYDV
jgi:hypothetical protein